MREFVGEVCEFVGEVWPALVILALYGACYGFIGVVIAHFIAKYW